MNKTRSYTWKLLLIPFAWLYGLVIWIRNSFYDHGVLKSSSFKIPLISVGNITVGGTGKTPHVEYLAELLNSEFRVATLSRGYKRRTRDFRMAADDSNVSDIGDEPLQIKKRFPGIDVAVDRKRANGIRELMNLAPWLEVILLDDAFQHRSIKPGLSILLIDYARPIDRDRLLPAGMLREPAANRSRADIILVTRTPEDIKTIELQEYVNNFKLSMGQHLYFTTMQYGDLYPVFPDSTKRDASWFKKHAGAVLIIAGIANPRPLRQYAMGINSNIRELSFPDHHHYSGRDMEKITRSFRQLKEQHKEVLVLTTEKDAMRLHDHNPDEALRNDLHAVRIHVHFLNDDKEKFDRQIVSYVNSNKRSRILYQGENS